MLDRIGVAQHHDGITGTGKQAVADDYSWRVSTGIDHNTKVYSQEIASRVEKLTGIKSSFK